MPTLCYTKIVISYILMRRKGIYFMMNETKEKNRKAKAIIAVLNDKGGCGKSTSTFHIAGELAKRGRKVLVVDADKQRNTSIFFLAEEESEYDMNTSKTLLHVLMEEEKIEDVIKKNYIKTGNNKPKYFGIDVVPGDVRIEDQEKFNDKIKHRDTEDIFKNLDYDYILIDCPPSNQMIYRLVLEQWASHVLIPMSNDISSIMGMSDLIAKIDAAREKNTELKIIGSFYSMFLPVTLKSKSYFQVMEKKFPTIFIKKYIPFCEDVKKSLEDEGRPLAFYRKSKACGHVEELVSQILKRI